MNKIRITNKQIQRCCLPILIGAFSFFVMMVGIQSLEGRVVVGSIIGAITTIGVVGSLVDFSKGG